MKLSRQTERNRWEDGDLQRLEYVVVIVMTMVIMMVMVNELVGKDHRGDGSYSGYTRAK